MKKGKAFIITGLLLIAAALFLTGYNIWDNYRAGKATDAALDQLAPRISEDPVPPEGRNAIEYPDGREPEEDLLTQEIEYPDYVLDPNMEMPVEEIDGIEYIGVLSMPTIERELPVISEWSYPNLKISPCRYTGSAYLDNMVVCAHNYEIHFGLLKNLSYGDEITFTDIDGNVFTYEVKEIVTLQPGAVHEMTTGDWDLTLFTCTIGGATRVTVRCEKVKE